jgi:hypothetical protein
MTGGEITNYELQITNYRLRITESARDLRCFFRALTPVSKLWDRLSSRSSDG